MTQHLFRKLTWTEVRERAAQGAVIVIPVAAIEQHGYHLPIDTDNVLVEHVTEEAARRSNGGILTAPMIHYGFNEHNMGFPGTITIRETVFIDFCYDVAHSFVRQGFDRIVFVNGHGSNQMLATPEKGKAFAECAINNLVEFARLFREMQVTPEVDLNYRNGAL